ncbi:MAG: hypothetical protein ACRCZZ_05420 [Phocaeicola sp.]
MRKWITVQKDDEVVCVVNSNQIVEIEYIKQSKCIYLTLTNKKVIPISFASDAEAKLWVNSVRYSGGGPLG